MTLSVISLVGLAISMILLLTGFLLPSYDLNSMSNVDAYAKRQAQDVVDSLRLSGFTEAQLEANLRTDPRFNENDSIRFLQSRFDVIDQGQFWEVIIPYNYKNLFNIQLSSKPSSSNPNIQTTSIGQLEDNGQIGNFVTVTLDKV